MQGQTVFRKPLLFAILGMMGVSVAAPVHAQTPIIIGDRKDVGVKPLHFPRNQTIHGYDSFWFEINNMSKTVPHTLTVTVPRQSSMGQLRGIARTVELKPGEKTQLCLWFPALRMQGWDVEFKLDGRLIPAGTFGQGYTTDRGMHRWTQKNIYILGSPAAPSQMPYQQNVAKANTAPANRALEYRQTDIGPLLKNQAHWHTGSDISAANRRQGQEVFSKHWLSYSKYDGVVFTAKEWQSETEEIRQGVLRWVECGGSLVIHGAWTAPDHWKRFEQKVGGLTGYHLGFGECMVIPEPNSDKWQPAVWRYLAESWAMSAAPFHVARTAGEAHTLFKVVDDVEVPVRGLFGLMVGFVILIGPVNLYVLSRWKQRIWLLATVPAVSLVTCLTVLGYMVATEGFGSSSRVEAITVLDENSGRAATVGWIGAYATVTPSDGLRFDEDTELTPQWDTSQWRTHVSRTIDWTNGQHLATGWMTPRLPTTMLARKSEHRREKLAVRKNAEGKLVVSNPFQHALKSLHVADAQGKIYETRELSPGGEAVLVSKEFTCNPLAKGRMRELFWTGWLTGGESLAKNPELYLQPGCYVAVLDASPFLEDGMSAVDHRQAKAVVFGIMKEPVE